MDREFWTETCRDEIWFETDAEARDTQAAIDDWIHENDQDGDSLRASAATGIPDNNVKEAPAPAEAAVEYAAGQPFDPKWFYGPHYDEVFTSTRRHLEGSLKARPKRKQKHEISIRMAKTSEPPVVP